MLFRSATRGAAPYKIVLTHGFIMGPDGQKMSKSLGNVMKPEKIIDKHGADILRLWVASSDYRGDVRISEEIFRNLIESYRRIRNTARFLLANLDGFDPATDILPHEELAPVDQYIMLKLERLRTRVTTGFDEYEFHQPMTLIHQFCDNELSSFYIDVSKDKLYADAKDAMSRRSAQRISCIRVAVDKSLVLAVIRIKRIVDSIRRERDGHRQITAGKSFGNGHDIRRDSCMVTGK